MVDKVIDMGQSGRIILTESSSDFSSNQISRNKTDGTLGKEITALYHPFVSDFS